MGATETGYKCCEGLLKQGQDISGIVSIAKKFSISYAKDRGGVTNVLHRDFAGLAREYNVPYMEISNGMKEAGDFIDSVKPDFALAIGWYYMIPKSMRDKIPKGVAGVHASLLPRYRGGAPLVWAIINGETETGVSLFYFEDGVDTGDLLDQRKVQIFREDTIGTLYERVNDIAVDMVLETIPKLARGEITARPQDHTKMTLFSQRSPEDGIISWEKTPDQIYNWVRAQTRPYPGAFTHHGDTQIKIWAGRPYEGTSMPLSTKPGTIFAFREGNLYVRCREGGFVVTDFEGDISLDDLVGSSFNGGV